MSTGLYEYLVSLANAGISFFPANIDKVPQVETWSPYQQRRPTDEEIRSWVKVHECYGGVCGVVSGNLECYDLDIYHDSTGTLDEDWHDLVENTCPGLTAKLVKHRTQRGGYHYLYRCEVIGGSQKLAYDDARGKECVVETKGEGGFFMMPPSKGYEVLQGSILDVPTITIEERDILLSCGRSFEKRVKKEIVKDVGRVWRRKDKLSPGDDYNQRGEVIELLERHGWRCPFQKGEVIYLCRPGKTRGTSATFNFGGSRGLYVFSSNAEPFDSPRMYQPFAVYAILVHGGDFKKAARTLYDEGFGDRRDDNPSAEPGEEGGEQEASEAATKRSSGLAKAEEFIESNYNLRRNLISGVYEYQILVEDKGGSSYWSNWALIDDATINSMKKKLMHAKISYTTPEIIIYSNETYQYDPFAEYVDSLKPPGGNDYITKLAMTVATVPGFSNTWTEYLRKWMVAHMAQIVDGKANHTALIFKGAQGVGKTTWLNQLCPPSLRNDYLIVSDIEANNKDHQLRLAENWIYNLDELENMQRQDIGHLKSLFTVSSLKLRRPYARTPEVLKRKASFVGSVNKDRFLTDDTGNRRFFVIEAVAFDNKHNVDIDRCWGEALELYRSGYIYWLEQKDVEMVNALNESHRVVPLVEHLVVQHLEPCEVEGDWSFMTTTTIAETLQKRTDIKLNINDYFIRQLGSALQKHGFKRGTKKIEGTPRYGYFLKFLTTTSNGDQF